MQPKVRVSMASQSLLRCPICHTKVAQEGQQFVCANETCAAHFPIIDGVPIFLNEKSSVYSIENLVSSQQAAAHGEGGKGIGLKETMRELIPPLSKNIKARTNYGRLSHLLLSQSSSPRVLVLGGKKLGDGMECLTSNSAFEFVETDIAFGPRTMLICDAHDIPFDDGSFDCVIVQAVLQCLLDPYRCVDEIHRVLNDKGIVYSEMPFMQQVLGRYDFTRFTHRGHRRLFRKFEEIDSGAVCGPGMALAWSYQYFLLSFTTSRSLKALLKRFAAVTAFFLPYVDSYLIDKPGTLDAASGYYFMGRKGEHVLSDRELMKL